MDKVSRDIGISFSMFGIGYMRNSNTVTGQYKFVTNIWLIGFITITVTTSYYLR